MKAFVTCGIVDEYLELIEVENTTAPTKYVQEIYDLYPPDKWYKTVSRLGEVKLTELPGGFDFMENFRKVGTLPGVHPIWEAPEEKIRVFLAIKEKLEKEKKEKTAAAIEEHKKWEAERAEQKVQYAVIKIYTLLLPKGGEEDGQDGYFDGILKHIETSKEIRMVARNVFDFGFYVYPKRVESTDDVFHKENWTEEEKQFSLWLSRFSPFTTEIRM